MLNVTRIPAFADNYLWLLQRDHKPSVVAVDPGDADAVMRVLTQQQWTLAAILVTHHHRDHCGGVALLKRQFGCPVWGPAIEAIADVDHPISDAGDIDVPTLGEVNVLSLPGHTHGHLGYFVDRALFCGDVLFGSGCGRLFEGTAAQMFASLQQIIALPDDTQVYCAHEYTEANLKFALSIEPEHPVLRTRLHRWQTNPQPTVPLFLGEEKCSNPFLRGDDHDLQRRVGERCQRRICSALDCFTELRRLKDQFRA